MPAPARILVVDDEPVVLTSIRKILTRVGHEVETATSADEVLARLDADHYDLLITDLIMPGMDGIELLGVLKRKALNIPSIMVTGYPTIRTGIQALRLGAVDYVPKPFTRQELLSPVQRALHRGPVEAEPGEPDDKERSPLPGGAGDEITPGATYWLPAHAWATFEQEGTFRVGVLQSFLESVGTVAEITAPGENDLMEQGHPSLTLRTADGQTHTVFAPLSGRVVAANEAVLADPGRLDSQAWVVRIVPHRMADEVSQLLARR